MRSSRYQDYIADSFGRTDLKAIDDGLRGLSSSAEADLTLGGFSDDEEDDSDSDSISSDSSLSLAAASETANMADSGGGEGGGGGGWKIKNNGKTLAARRAVSARNATPSASAVAAAAMRRSASVTSQEGMLAVGGGTGRAGSGDAMGAAAGSRVSVRRAKRKAATSAPLQQLARVSNDGGDSDDSDSDRDVSIMSMRGREYCEHPMLSNFSRGACARAHPRRIDHLMLVGNESIARCRSFPQAVSAHK